jgi:phage shock protein PspC (stress-responsive transcriptional regulator)
MEASPVVGGADRIERSPDSMLRVGPGTFRMVGGGVFGEPGGMTEPTAEQTTMKRLERSRSDRMLAGVCGGLARTFGIHPAFYRVGFVVLTLIGGAGILIYLAAALVIPDEAKQDSIAAEILRDARDRPWPLVGLGLVATAVVVLLSRVTLWPRGDAAWILLLIAGLAIVVSTRRRALSPPPAVTAPPEVSEAETTAVMPSPAAVSEPARRGWGAGRIFLVTLGSLVALLLIAVATFLAIFPVHLSHGVGNQAFTPAGISDLRRTYRLGVGDLKIDLRNVRLPVGETPLKARVDIGDLVVVVPADAAVRAYGKARLGYVNVLGEEDDGRNVDESIAGDGKRVLDVDARVQVGSVRITRVP